MDKKMIAEELVKVARELVASTSGFMSTYHGKTYDNPLDSSMRVWSFSKDGEKMPLIMTEMYARKWNGEDAIMFNAIISPEKQGTGMASYVLKQITDMADKNGVPMYLGAKPFGTIQNKLNKSQLVSWYKRNGWVSEGGGDMVRRPQ